MPGGLPRGDVEASIWLVHNCLMKRAGKSVTEQNCKLQGTLTTINLETCWKIKEMKASLAISCRFLHRREINLMLYYPRCWELNFSSIRQRDQILWTTIDQGACETHFAKNFLTCQSCLLCTYQCQAGGRRAIGRDFDRSLWPGGREFDSNFLENVKIPPYAPPPPLPAWHWYVHYAILLGEPLLTNPA